MPKPLLLIAPFILLATTQAGAQVVSPGPVSVELQAEHHQWEADHQKWTREHVALARRLRAIADGIERGDAGLEQHGSEISVHGADLKRGVDSIPLERTHALLRSEHEETRIAHHDLVDAVRALEIAARDDETTRTIEDGQREPGAVPGK